MSRYRLNRDDPPRVEAMPKGTPRTVGRTFAEAKKELVAYLSENRDVWAAAVKAARKITRADAKAGPAVAQDEEE